VFDINFQFKTCSDRCCPPDKDCVNNNAELYAAVFCERNCKGSEAAGETCEDATKEEVLERESGNECLFVKWSNPSPVGSVGIADSDALSSKKADNQPKNLDIRTQNGTSDSGANKEKNVQQEEKKVFTLNRNHVSCT